MVCGHNMLAHSIIILGVYGVNGYLRGVFVRMGRVILVEMEACVHGVHTLLGCLANDIHMYCLRPYMFAWV
jgi:hypothetical protein